MTPFSKRAVELVVTVGYVGRIPRAPGTASAAVTAVLLLIFPQPWQVMTLFVLSTVVGLVLARPAEEVLGRHDPPEFVLDEVAGMSAAMLFIPVNWPNVLIAFGIFRFFDMVKPLGIRKVDQFHHPSSVVFDDLLAALYTNIVMQVLVRLYAAMAA